MIFQKETAVSLLRDPHFLGAWDHLWQNCPWATVFQHRDFIITWFQFYPTYQPLVVTDWDGKTLTGILILTFEDKDIISGAGIDQAEYQAWLSYPIYGDEFIHNSIQALVKQFPKKTIHFKYLPPQTPLDWLKKSDSLKKHFFLKEHDQPLMRLNKEHLELELKKKNRKEKINRLKRIGNLQLTEITSVLEFEKVIDEMILQNDFRKGAIYGKMVFQKEPQRKDFLLKMFELGHLHVSLLKLNETVIASNAGFSGEDVVHLQGINSHSPFFSKYSPGILLFLMLGLQLSGKGKNYFDLTPGGIEGYKSMLANSVESAHELRVSKTKNIFSFVIKEKIRKWLLTQSERSSFFSFALSTYRDKIKGHKPTYNVKDLNWKSLSNPDVSNLERDKSYFNLTSLSIQIKRNEFLLIKKNQINDLFLFVEEKEKLNKRDFFSDSLKRIEMGHDLITVVQEEKLKAVLWVIKDHVKYHLENSESNSTFDARVLSFSYCEEGCLQEILVAIKLDIQHLFPEIENFEGILIELN